MNVIKVLWPVSLARMFARGACRVLIFCSIELVAVFILLTEGVIDKWWLLTHAERTRHEGIKIYGGSEFINMTAKALELLKSTSCFETIRSNIYMIKEGRRSRMRVGLWPTFSVGHATWSSSVIWYAGGIAHEAYHNVLLFQRRSYIGTEAERHCMEFELRVLKELGAPLPMLEYIAATMKNPTHQGNRWSIADYVKQNW